MNRIHHRESIRLKGYDYSQPGWYFLTFCTQDRVPLFGRIADGKMVLNDGGMVARRCWLEIPNHFPQMVLDEFVVMPNHVHGIIEIVGNDGEKNETGAKNISPPQIHPQNQSQIQPKIQPQLPPQKSPPTKFHSPSQTIGSMIRGFKIGVTKWFRQNTNIYTVWQRNYYDNIIHTEQGLIRVRKYIRENPAKWREDGFFDSP